MASSEPDPNNQTGVSVRELGGEVWAELSSFSDSELDWQIKNRIVDLVMGVVARHAGAAIMNDTDLPVLPLPARGNH
jgi:hypothetical protein